MYEIIAAATNVTALAVIGFIYVAYIRNLRSVNHLKEAQLKVSEQNLKLWKDRVLQLERRTPEFVEKQLGERIRIREDELARLIKDSASHEERIDKKNREIKSLQDAVEKAAEYRNSITVWDAEKSDFIEVSDRDLEQKHIGSLCVDSASLMICDPMYPKMAKKIEKEEFQKLRYMYRVNDTGEYFCVDDESESFSSELLGFEEEITVKEMVDMSLISKVEYDGNVPAIRNSYIGGELCDQGYRSIQHLSFLNGRLGAGISISIGADGVYPVYTECYKGQIQRIIIEL